MYRKPPIGISDFREVIESNHRYVDKTLLIQEILDAAGKILLITRPRRFGKTLNLSMLRYFFEQAPPDIAPIPDLFTELAIARQPGYAERGRYPVIFLTFKDIKETTFEDCVQQLQAVLAEEYGRHRFLLEQNLLNAEEKETFELILKQRAGRTATERALKGLIGYLQRAAGRRVILLIDEYDTPVHAAYTHGYYDEAVVFIRNIFGAALKDNPNLEKGVLTGILRVAKESFFSGLNNIKVCTVLDRPFADKFGFTEEEVSALLDEYKLVKYGPEARKWYNGYRFGESTIYNPWSILHYMDNPIPAKPYWVNTSSNDLVRDLIMNGSTGLHSNLETLLSGQTVETKLHEHIALREVESRTEFVLSLFVHCGYLKPIETLRERLGLRYRLALPNLEVESFFHDMISAWMNRSLDNDEQRTMLKALVSGDIRTFGKYLQRYVKNVLSVHDIAGDRPERVYHAFVLGLLVGLGKSYQVKSNRESGFGRYDVLLIPADVEQLGLVLEFKQYDAEDDPDVDAALTGALEQIRERDYAAELFTLGVREVLGVGIVFVGKDVKLRPERLEKR